MLKNTIWSSRIIEISMTQGRKLTQIFISISAKCGLTLGKSSCGEKNVLHLSGNLFENFYSIFSWWGTVHMCCKIWYNYFFIFIFRFHLHQPHLETETVDLRNVSGTEEGTLFWEQLLIPTGQKTRRPIMGLSSVPTLDLYHHRCHCGSFIARSAHGWGMELWCGIQTHTTYFTPSACNRVKEAAYGCIKRRLLHSLF